MKAYKIFALMYADLMIFRNTKWKIAEYVYFPITTVLIWGLFSNYISGYALEAGLVVLVVNILWNFAYLAQSHANMQINEDSWSGSLKQIIITGVSDFEYITARILFASILSLCVFALIVAMSLALFNITVVSAHWQIFAAITSVTLLASIALAIIVAGAMIALGREYGFLAWTIMQIFVLLSAPFYPASIFPEFMQPVVHVMPYTDIFEATRSVVAGDITAGWQNLVSGFFVSFVYLLIALPFYKAVFKKARQKGWLVRLS